MSMASYIIGTDETVIGMGGFMGADNSPSVAQLTGWVAEGKLKFVLGGRVDPAAYGGSTGSSASAAQSPFSMMMGGGGQTLYRCGS
jgi:hypothetical protein